MDRGALKTKRNPGWDCAEEAGLWMLRKGRLLKSQRLLIPFRVLCGAREEDWAGSMAGAEAGDWEGVGIYDFSLLR